MKRQIFAILVGMFLGGMIPQAKGQTVLVSDDFEGSLGNWTANSDAGLYTWAGDPDVNYAMAGSGAAYIFRSYSLPDVITLTNPLSLDSQGYTSVTISFDHKWQVQNGTIRWNVQYSSDDGVTWLNLGDASSNTNGLTYTKTLNEGTYVFSDTALFRIGFLGGGNTQRGYLDNMLITGSPEYVPPPTLASGDIVDDQSGGPVEIGTVVVYTLTFSEDMDAATVTAADFGNGGDAPITIGTIAETSVGVFTVEVTPTAVGSLQFGVNAGAVLAAPDGRAVATTSAILDDTTITVQDTTPPTLSGIVDNQSGGPVPANTLVTYTLTFDKAMDINSFGAADFANAGDSTISVGTISEVSSTEFTVLVTPTTGGTLQLQIPTTATLLDYAGNALVVNPALTDDTTITVTADAPPELVSIVDDQGGNTVGYNSVVQYTVSFNEDIDETTVTSNDFDNAGSASISVGLISELSPGVFSVAVTPTSGGTLQLRIPTTASITDASGIYLINDPALVDDTVISVDGTPPTLAASDIVDNKSGGPIYMHDTVTYTVTFSEDMDASTVTSNDFANAGTSAATIGDPAETSSGVFSVPVTVTTEGTLQLEIQAGADVRDFYGVALDTSSAIQDDTVIPVNYARMIFIEDFESPVVVGYDDKTKPDTGWLTAVDNGFGWNNHGLINEITTSYSTPYGEQGYTVFYNQNAFLVSDSICSARIYAGVTYILTFRVATTEPSTADSYKAELVAFSDGENRQSDETNGDTLAVASGTVSSSDMSKSVSLTFTATNGHVNIGDTIAVRLVGAASAKVVFDHLALLDDMEIHAPVISSLIPADEASGVALDSDFVTTFDENIEAGSGSVVISNLTEGTSVTIPMNDAQVSISGATLTINPSVNLEAGDSYAILIETNAVKDVYITYFAGITDTTTWNFVADAADTIAPTLLSVSPANGSFAVNPAANLVATFSEPVVPASGGTITLTNITEGTARIINLTDAQVTASGAEITINPTTDLDAGDHYAVLFDGSAIEDLAGNKFAGISSTNTWHIFVAGPPTIASASIVDDQGGDPVYAYERITYTLTFSQDMDGGTVEASDFANAGTSVITVESVTETSAGVFTVVVQPTAAGTLRLAIAAGADVRDVFGFAMDTSSALADDTTITVNFARLLLFEDFEEPDVSAAASDGNTTGTIPVGWVGSTDGHMATARGIVDEAHDDFTDPGGEQAFAFRSGNSGLTSAEGQLLAISRGVTYMVTFDVVRDGHDAGTSYNAGLVAYEPGAIRTDVRGLGVNAIRVLASTGTGTATSDGEYTTIRFSYTIDPVADADVLGKDLAVQFDAFCIIDNVMVRDNFRMPPSVFRFR